MTSDDNVVRSKEDLPFERLCKQIGFSIERLITAVPMIDEASLQMCLPITKLKVFASENIWQAGPDVYIAFHH